jgi:DegV family protein with EDD domain
VADVAVVTDSTACLPTALVDSLGITVVSLYYDIAGTASPDGGHEMPGRGQRESEFDGDFGRFFAELDASKTVATTSPPTIEDFVVAYERLLQDHSTVVSVLIASSLNPTCSIAREAAALLNPEVGGDRVVVIDSAGVAGHLGVQALAGARAAAAGADALGVIAAVRRARQEVRQWFVVDTLEYLHRGGRIGTAAAWLGSALDLKPILMIESEIKAVERVRTRRRAIERLVELMRQRRAVGADQWFVTHTYAYEDAKRLAERLAVDFGTEPLFISAVGPVIATHTGPGTVSAGGLPGAVLG